MIFKRLIPLTLLILFLFGPVSCMQNETESKTGYNKTLYSKVYYVIKNDSLNDFELELSQLKNNEDYIFTYTNDQLIDGNGQKLLTRATVGQKIKIEKNNYILFTFAPQVASEHYDIDIDFKFRKDINVYQHTPKNFLYSQFEIGNFMNQDTYQTLPQQMKHNDDLYLVYVNHDADLNIMNAVNSYDGEIPLYKFEREDVMDFGFDFPPTPCIYLIQNQNQIIFSGWTPDIPATLNHFSS